MSYYYVHINHEQLCVRKQCMPSHTGLCKPVAGYVFIVVVFLVHTNAKCHLQLALFYLDIFKHVSCRSYIRFLLFVTITGSVIRHSITDSKKADLLYLTLCESVQLISAHSFCTIFAALAS